MIPHFSPFELGIIAIIVIMLFGVGKLPDLGRAMGETIRGFRKSVRDADDEIKEATKVE